MNLKMSDAPSIVQHADEVPPARLLEEFFLQDAGHDRVTSLSFARLWISARRRHFLL